MVTTREARFTRADYARLPEGFPAELLDGVLVKEPSPSGWHQVLVGKIYAALCGVVGPRRAVISPIDVFVDEWNVLQPDVLALPASAPVRPGDRQVAIPELVVEVLSASTASRDRDRKVGIYLRAGVAEVWLVDPDPESAEIHTPAGVERFAGDAAPSSAAMTGFALDLPSLFRG